MNQKKLTFESENLVVGSIYFRIAGWRDPEPIAKYLSEFGFHAILKESLKGTSEVVIFQITNPSKVDFLKSYSNRQSQSCWTGLILKFLDEDGAYFYSLVQQKKIDWSILNLSSLKLGRLDVSYFRKSNRTEDHFPELFLKNSCQKVNSKSNREKAFLKKTRRGFLLEIGNQSDSNYYRIYQKEKQFKYTVYSEINWGLNFELVLQKQWIQLFQKFFWNNQIEEFEDKVVKHFYKHSKKSLVLDSSHTDWLSIGLRKITATQKSKTNLNSLVSSYLRKGNLDSFVKKKQFFQFLQFLSFIRTLDSSKQWIDDQAYCVVEFAVMDFISFTGGNVKSTYQRTQALEFLKSLQEIQPLTRKFSNLEFQRSVIFPSLKFQKKNRRWTVQMAIGEELYFYPYPFFFPNSFLLWKNKYDLEIKLLLIESLSTVGLEKKILVKPFFNQFSVPNKERTKIKQHLIDLLSILKDSQLIENELSLLSKDGLSHDRKIEDLSTKIISKSESLSFWEKLE